MIQLSTTNIATLAYQAFFNRAPDISGLDNWDNLQPTQIVEGLLASTEASTTLPSSSYGFVAQLYSNLFGRVPDQGATNWMNVIDAGLMTKAEVALALITSSEAVTRNFNGLVRAEQALVNGVEMPSGPLNNADFVKIITNTETVVNVVEVIKEVEAPTVTTVSLGSVHPIFTKTYTVGGDILPGTGISGAANWVTQTNHTTNSMLTLAMHERQGPFITATVAGNEIDWTSSAGSQIGNPNRGFVAIDFGVSTGVDQIRTGEFRLGIDIDPTAAKNFLYLTIENQGNGVHVWKDQNGNVRVTDGDGSRTGVSIDSTNMAFFPEILKGATPGDVPAGEYSISLEQINLAGVVTNGLYGDLILT